MPFRRDRQLELSGGEGMKGKKEAKGKSQMHRTMRHKGQHCMLNYRVP